MTYAPGAKKTKKVQSSRIIRSSVKGPKKINIFLEEEGGGEKEERGNARRAPHKHNYPARNAPAALLYTSHVNESPRTSGAAAVRKGSFAVNKSEENRLSVHNPRIDLTHATNY